MLFGGRTEITENLLAELEPKQRSKFKQLITDLFNKLKQKFSKNKGMLGEITRLENMFIETAKSVETKDTADDSGGVEYAIYSGSKDAENLYDTLEDMKPQSEEEWSSFNRQFANKTNGLKKSQKANIMIYTIDHAYFVSANGYMRGRIVEKMQIDGNEERIKTMIKEFKNGTFVFGEGTNLLAQSIRGNRGRGYRHHASLKETLAAEGYEEMDGDTYGGNDRGNNRRSGKTSSKLEYSLPTTDSLGNNLSQAQQEYFSKAK